MDNLISPLMDGLTQAMQIHGMVQHQRDQNEAMQRQRFMDARNNRIQDMMLQNQQEDRAEKKQTTQNSTMAALNAAGAQPLDADGTYSGSIPATAGVPLSTQMQAPAMGTAAAPPAPVAAGDLSGALGGPSRKTSLQALVAPQMTPQPMAPPTSSPGLTVDTPALAAVTKQPEQAVRVPASPMQVQTVGNQKFMLPSQGQQDARATAQAQRKKKIEEEVELPDGTTADARAIPVMTNKNTVDAENARSLADRSSREKTSAITDERDRAIADTGVKSREKIAANTQAGDDRRAGAVQAGENARAAGRQAKPLNALEKAKYDTTLNVGMARAEREYAVGRIRALRDAKKEDPEASEKDMDPDTLSELAAARDRAKQDAHNSYREKLGGFGVDVAPIDFAQQTQQRASGGKQAAAPPASPQTTPQATPQATQAAPAPAKSATPKAFPRARLAEYAKQNGMTPEKAEQALKTSGYAVQ